MICETLDKLDAEFCAVRTQRAQLFWKQELTPERQEELDHKELERLAAIKDHKLFGHWPSPCPGD